MKSIYTLTTFSLLSLTTALPQWLPWSSSAETCMTQSVGEEIVLQFGTLLTNFDADVATNLLDPDNFMDMSDSINFLTSYPPSQPTFPTASSFIQGQGSQPPISLEILAIDSISCDGVITFRWSAGVGMNKTPVKGINVLYTTMEDGGDDSVVGEGGWRLSTVFSEFNSAAWSLGIGGGCVVPGSGSGSGSGSRSIRRDTRTMRTKKSAALKKKEEEQGSKWWLWDEMKMI